ncbi:FAD-binding protein [Parasedimentitalea maritima]|uniref:FAD-binding protein n=1 Tax=Parasedimentitalea maritima TaxID=2578117 RepID=A0ABY2UZK6_9RHOB|nr:FAD-binding protein [Zongyanglinia marina]TLP68896.1 FAD-binding protein [Zongyanglinia marina]
MKKMMLKPRTETELAEMIAGATGPLAFCGGGTRGFDVAGEALTTSGLSGVELYEPGALTMVARAGTPVAEIEALLAENGQRLAFEPMDHRGLLGTEGVPTIGGVFAANISGPRRIQVGAARDFLLGVRFVDGTGQVVKNGGRVMKNVTGYDLVKLMSGAHGTLGVLSEVSFKVLPRPEVAATVVVQDVDLEVAVQVMSAALGSPFDVTGAAYDPVERRAYVRIEGFAGSVDYRVGRLVADLARFGAVQQVNDSENLWRGIRDVSAFHGNAGDVWRISVKPSDAVELAEQLQAEALQFDWGGGLIWALVPAGTDLRARIAVPGHATLMRAGAETRGRLGQFQPEPAPLAAISAELRAKFDPRGILNTGLMG